MLKGVYDTNPDNIVDRAALANAVPWGGITGLPATFLPVAHASTHKSGGPDALALDLLVQRKPLRWQNRVTEPIQGHRSESDLNLLQLPIPPPFPPALLVATPDRFSCLKFPDYFFTPKTPSFAALATRNLTTVLAGILIFCCVFGLKPVRAFLFCFTSLPKPGKTNSPFFLISL